MDLDKQLAAQTTGLDAIVGGDSHTFLYKAVETANANGQMIPIVQDGEFGVNLGRFDLHFMRNAEGTGWKLAKYEYALLPVGPQLKDAPDVASVVAPYYNPFQSVVGRVAAIGKTPEERTRLTTQTLVDALREDAHADYALNPAGGGMFDAFHSREVTRFDIYATFPFKNHVVFATLTGEQLLALLKAQPDSVLSGDRAAIRSDAHYRVALVDHTATDSYHLAPDTLTDTGHDMRDAVITYLRRGK